MMIAVALFLLAQTTPLEPTHRYKMESHAWGVDFMPGGQKLFVIEMRDNGDSSAAAILELPTGRQVLSIVPAVKRRIMYLTLSNDGSTIAGIVDGCFLSAWDSTTGRQVLETFPSGTITRPALSPDGRIITHANPKGGDVPLYQVSTGKLMRSLPRGELNGGDTPLVFSPDGKYLASTSRHEPALLWNVASGKLIATLTTPEETWEPMFSSDGQLLVFIGESSVRIYRVADRTEVRLLRSDDKEIVALAFSPDYRFLALGVRNGGVKIRELASGTDVFRMATNPHTLKFSPDSASFASCDKNEVLLWRLAPEGLVDLSDDERMQLWNLLASPEATAAYPAIRKLARGGPATADFLRRRLVDRPLDAPAFKALHLALQGSDAAARDKAAEEAADAAHDPALWDALQAGSPQVQKMTEAQRAFVLPSASVLRRQRAVWVLERMGALDPLKEIAQGDPRARQTIDARAALQRLKPR